MMVLIVLYIMDVITPNIDVPGWAYVILFMCGLLSWAMSDE